VLECRIPLAYINKPSEGRYLSTGIGEQFGFVINQIDNDSGNRDHQLQWSAGHTDETWNHPQYHGTVTFLSYHKLKFEAVNAVIDTVINDSAGVWYYPDSIPACDFSTDITSGSVPLIVHFSDASQHSVKTRIWDFTNNGSFDSWEQNPVHTYIDADSYSVKLIISDFAFQETRIKENYITAYFDTIPNLFHIADIPDDQGGWVNLQFARSAYDTTSVEMSGEYYIIDTDNGSGWRKADSIGATSTSIYSLNIPTPMDSTSESTGLLDFRVTAYMNAGTFVSQTVSGYSVDNRRPAAPKNLHALLTEELTVSLTWNTSNAPDLKQYTVYRSTDDFHFIGIGTTTDTTLVDDDVELNQEYYYVVTAMDSSGNESSFSVSVSITVAISNIGEDVSIPTHYYLAQNYPNPFNPVTTIRYGLPRSAYVSIIIYDILGHRVRNLVNMQKSAGYHKEQWNGMNNVGEMVSSGIYYYKIESKDFNQTMKMVLIR
jgi:PKD repeat protein